MAYRAGAIPQTPQITVPTPTGVWQDWNNNTRRLVPVTPTTITITTPGPVIPTFTPQIPSPRRLELPQLVQATVPRITTPQFPYTPQPVRGVIVPVIPQPVIPRPIAPVIPRPIAPVIPQPTVPRPIAPVIPRPIAPVIPQPTVPRPIAPVIPQTTVPRPITPVIPQTTVPRPIVPGTVTIPPIPAFDINQLTVAYVKPITPRDDRTNIVRMIMDDDDDNFRDHDFVPPDMHITGEEGYIIGPGIVLNKMGARNRIAGRYHFRIINRYQRNEILEIQLDDGEILTLVWKKNPKARNINKYYWFRAFERDHRLEYLPVELYFNY